MKLPESTKDPLQEHGGANASVVSHEHVMVENASPVKHKHDHDGAPHDHMHMRPKWNKLRYDLSVVEPPDQAYFETGAAGRLLCAACITGDVDEEAEEEIEQFEILIDSKKKKGGSPTKVPSKKAVAAADAARSEGGKSMLVPHIGEPDPTPAGGSKRSLFARAQTTELSAIAPKIVKPLKEEILPKTLTHQPGMFCGATVKTDKKASLGYEVSYKRKDADDMYTIYCHVDILCARNLPAMDDNGLADPVWTLEVKNKTV
jgi:hypothetical protein